MVGDQHVRWHANADADTYSHPDAYPYANTNAAPNTYSYADTNNVRGLGRRQDLHRWAGGELSRCNVQGAFDPHRLRRHQLESEGHADLVDDRRNLQYHSDADANTYADSNTYPDADAYANANADSDSNTDTDADADRLEETSARWLHARKLCERLGLYPYG